MYFLTQIITITMFLIAIYTDVMYLKIPNRLTFPLMAVGLLLCGFPLTAEGWSRFGVAVLMILISGIGLMGMGDLKLCMAVLCLRGFHDMYITILFGSVLLLIFCCITKTEKVKIVFKDLLYSALYGTKYNHWTKEKYPFALPLGIGYLFTFVF